MIFQEPMTSLNPVVTVGRQIAEVFIRHEGMPRRDAWERAVDVLRLVRMPEPERRAHEYPHQLSGGMNQRVLIAMAVACGPKVLLADEPTTALDVTIQAQILDLMIELKEKLGTAIVLITHDMGIIAENARRVVVMCPRSSTLRGGARSRRAARGRGAAQVLPGPLRHRRAHGWAGARGGRRVILDRERRDPLRCTPTPKRSCPRSRSPIPVARGASG